MIAHTLAYLTTRLILAADRLLRHEQTRRDAWERHLATTPGLVDWDAWEKELAKDRHPSSGGLW